MWVEQPDWRHVTWRLLPFLTLEELLQVFLAYFLKQKFHHIHCRKKKNFILDYLFWFLPETWTIFCELNHFCLLNLYHNSCRKRSWSRDRRCHECGKIFERKYNLNLHILNLLWKSPLVSEHTGTIWYKWWGTDGGTDRVKFRDAIASKKENYWCAKESLKNWWCVYLSVKK